MTAVPVAMRSFAAIAAAYLYGSALGDEPVGDIDLGVIEVQGGPPLGARELGRLERAIVEAFGGRLPPLDLRRMTPDQYLWVHEVVGTGRLIYEADRASRVALEVEARRRYLDTLWLRESYRARRRSAAHG